MNTVDSLKKLYKTMAGKDWPYDPNPTDAEVIDKIAADSNAGGSDGGGSGSGGGPVIKLKASMTDGTATADPLAAGLSLTDLSDATIEMYLTNGDLEVLAAIIKVCNVVVGLGNVIEMISVTYAQDGLISLILAYNPDTGVVTVDTDLGNSGGEDTPDEGGVV